MAFQNSDLSVIAYANGFTLWHYATSKDTMEKVLSAKYFGGVSTLFHDNDIMLINAKDGTGFRCVACATHEEIMWKTLS